MLLSKVCITKRKRTFGDGMFEQVVKVALTKYPGHTSMGR